MTYGVLKISQEEQLLIKYYIIKHLLLLRTQNVMNTIDVLLQVVDNFFDKKSEAGATTSAAKFKEQRVVKFAVTSKTISNLQLAACQADELHKPISRKLKKRRKVYSFLKIIYGMQT